MRLKELTEAAADSAGHGRSARSGRTNYTEQDPFFAERRFAARPYTRPLSSST